MHPPLWCRRPEKTRPSVAARTTKKMIGGRVFHRPKCRGQELALRAIDPRPPFPTPHLTPSEHSPNLRSVRARVLGRSRGQHFRFDGNPGGTKPRRKKVTDTLARCSCTTKQPVRGLTRRAIQSTIPSMALRSCQHSHTGGEIPGSWKTRGRLVAERMRLDMTERDDGLLGAHRAGRASAPLLREPCR